MVEPLQLTDWNTLERGIKKLVWVETHLALFRTGMATIRSDKLIFLSTGYSRLVHQKQPFTQTCTHTDKSHRVTLTVWQHRVLLSISVMVDE